MCFDLVSLLHFLPHGFLVTMCAQGTIQLSCIINQLWNLDKNLRPVPEDEEQLMQVFKMC